LVVLLLAVLIGLLAGLLRARLQGRHFLIPELRFSWLALLAFVPQLMAFQIPAARRYISDSAAGICLIASLVLLLFFVWTNISTRGFWLLGVGLILNLSVILANQGWMPISPHTASQLTDDRSAVEWKSGERFGNSKDKILPVEDTYLSLLSDRLLLPDWFPYRAAFSPGDLFIALGVFWLLCSSSDILTRSKQLI
jgi:hypothetical protein